MAGPVRLLPAHHGAGEGRGQPGAAGPRLDQRECGVPSPMHTHMGTCTEWSHKLPLLLIAVDNVKISPPKAVIHLVLYREMSYKFDTYIDIFLFYPCYEKMLFYCKKYFLLMPYPPAETKIEKNCALNYFIYDVKINFFTLPFWMF